MEKRNKGKFLPDEIVEAVLEHEEWAENIVLDHYFDRAFDRVSRYKMVPIERTEPRQ